ncbi:MAG: DUF6515 family protein [Syntrophales bacterium]
MDHKNKNRTFSIGLMMVIFSVLTLFILTAAASAADRRERNPRREFRDSRYHLERSYPARGQIVREIPRNRHAVTYRGARYYFYDGAWYRPNGGRFTVIAPPIGLFVSFLPPYYATIWVGGVPYYYANEVYYTHYADGYRVVDPPTENAVSQTPPPAEQLFIYPRNGQDEKQQADDRYQCHSWAVSQTGYDPTQPQTGSATSQRSDNRADYLRAMSACLDGRGYTVK